MKLAIQAMGKPTPEHFFQSKNRNLEYTLSLEKSYGASLFRFSLHAYPHVDGFVLGHVYSKF